MDLKKHIGLKVKAARQRKGITQEQLAEAVEKAVETISNIERGHALTGLDTLERVGTVLDQPLVYFFEDYGGPRATSRRRLAAERTIMATVQELSDDDAELAAALLDGMARHRQG
ncbi:MAG TPA: helix-turn-helix transcriptional regulator [Candidatus Omnitrophota bacterium]|nr:helix-turn-helix transcriptional regulator [Candidatus Omnitrophota bacterium]